MEWGLIELDQVTRWADEKILEYEDIDAVLCDGSLANDEKSALSALNSLARGSSLWPSATRVLRRILDIKDLSPKFASNLARQLYFLGLRNDAPEPYINLMHHWDYIDLAIDGIHGTPEQAVKEFVRDVSTLIESLSGVNS